MSPEVCNELDDDCDAIVDEDCRVIERDDAGPAGPGRPGPDAPQPTDGGLPMDCRCGDGDTETESDPCEGGQRTRTRECAQDCRWSTWSSWTECIVEDEMVACEGSAEEIEEVPCGCGGIRSRSRSCVGGTLSAWSGWGDCEGGTCEAIPSNIPRLTVIDASPDPLPLRPLSISLLEPAGGITRGGMLVENASDEGIVCYPRVTARFLGASGVLLELESFFHSPLYRTTSGELPCLGPGDIGAAYFIESEIGTYSPASTTRVEVEFDSLPVRDREARRSSLAPVIVAIAGEEITGYIEARSDIESASGTIFELFSGYIVNDYFVSVPALEVGERYTFAVPLQSGGSILPGGTREVLAYIRYRRR